MLKTIIIDDEENARETIESIVKQYCADVNIVAEASSVADGIEKINNYSPDLILLDIHLSDGNGFEILEKLDNINFKIIFVTGHEEFAIQAIKFSALDYLVKPIQPRELINAINRAKESIEKENIQLQLSAFLSNVKPGSNNPKKLILKTFESIYLINVNEIIRCESDKNYTTFILKDGKKLLVSRTIKEYDELLRQNNFFRVHQSHLINFQYFLRYDKMNGGYVVMTDNSKIPVSNRQKDNLMHALEKFQ
jgi:two-component system LytT family response regulator